ncbi:Hypothetical predicted protein [Podarcis lilfordi]|uniref:Uncharacterized protein n=1 Tax=Podarcis lilfordi TaxID=74358 RepID=A0AA35PRA7_9SAUR|nr:Hypothetical predicted protein [Podarcis lilfordi]
MGSAPVLPALAGKSSGSSKPEAAASGAQSAERTAKSAARVAGVRVPDGTSALRAAGGAGGALRIRAAPRLRAGLAPPGGPGERESGELWGMTAEPPARGEGLHQ